MTTNSSFLNIGNPQNSLVSNSAGGVHRDDASAVSVRSATTSAASNGRKSYDTQNLPNTQLSISSSSGQQPSSAQVDLTEIDGGLAMLLERSRQSLNSCKETVIFLKNRAKVEEDYGRSLQKVAQSTLKMIDRSGNHSQSTQQAAWQRLVEMHETLASNRMRFSITLSEMSDYLSNYVKAKEN
ncbi:hypothetical protein FB639_005766, partial [Coemansia asiatica]